MPTFDEFFFRATGHPPYGFQQRLASDGLPPVVQAPTGTGKTSVILAWLWRRLHGPDRRATARRLVFALPQRTLVEQVAGAAELWLANLDLTEEVPLHVVMGGAGTTQGRWRLDMDRPTIVVGTVDSLVSKALNRGYGISRPTYPIDFALVTNGAHWIVDEIQLCPESTTTLRQLAAFANPARSGSWATAEPFGLTCMSATVSAALLDTVDNPMPSLSQVLRIEPQERVGALARRLGARRTLRRLDCEPGDYKTLAAAVQERHRTGTLTLVVVNTVRAAREVYRALRDAPAECTLLHSRFRGVEREQLIRRLTEEPGETDHIVVSTQVVEAGIDVNASILFIEAAPWPSTVQRAGRCNRTGEVFDAEMWWLPPAAHAPYEKADIDATIAEVTHLDGEAVTGEELLSRDVATTDVQVSVIRRPDLLALFDTAPDLNGADVDIAPYVRDAEDLDVQLGWAEWTPADASGRPSAAAKAPEARFRCRVPLGELRALAKTKKVWRYEQAAGQWTQVTDRSPARPGEALVMAAKDGGYDSRTGFDPRSAGPVTGCPTLDEPSDPLVDAASGAEDAYRQDAASVAQRQWLSLQQHSDDVRDAALRLLESIGPVVSRAVAAAVVVAAYAHDVGKCHHVWQDALCALAPADERDQIDAERPWAKSAIDGRLAFVGGVNFRHELASLLLLDGPLKGLLDGVEDPDLVRYLVLAHHGKLRVQVRGLDETDEKALLGLKEGSLVTSTAMLGQPSGEFTVDLSQFAYGGDQSWTRTALALRDRYGPFLLAYLETIVRIADWRPSAQPSDAARATEATR
ncbi:MAG: CRISPR-associated endonuclease/helicase Cas3 [Micromonosporaceae bacterium]|jgi:CRISPR-associated endonuclease/helicase Cas3|nr:CRISPR-associated endonuclease/helicase Cas3 [Micromonosporaceae bacterium]